MKNITNRFRIPTLLGLAVIIVGIVTGVLLNLKQQTFISKAAPDLIPQNIILSNLTDTSVTISWQTPSQATSFIRFGQADFSEQTALDDRDSKSPQLHWVHYVTLENLLPKTTYQYKIISGKISSETLTFTTSTPLSSQTGFQPVIGSVLDNNAPLDDALVYLSIADATTQSALTKNSGNFLIPISQIRKSDLSDVYPLTEETVAKLTILSEKGQATVLLKLKNLTSELPPIILGENLDLTNPVDNTNYDLNGDGKINSTDMAIILQNFGTKPKNEQSSTIFKKADLNKDGAVDQKDVDLMLEKIKKTGNN